MFVRLLAGGVVAALAVTLSALTGPAVAGPAASADSKIEAAVLRPGTTTFWVTLNSEADLAPADGSAEAVYEAKTAHAERTQAGLRELLAGRGARYEPFWMDNSIKVTGDAALATELAARPEVARIEADESIAMPPLTPPSGASIMIADWNLHAVNAPRVWNELGVRGEGIVVASIDTGVFAEHPALVGSYRGTRPDGTFDHDHNWFDAAGYCPAAPCDVDGHGTHTMGTIVGRERVLEFGVAPAAKWISARACSNSCDRGHLLAAGQWILAPTDVDGRNPRPDLAPDIVNNSWGGTADEEWFAETVRAWVAAGIFPAFAAGNSGPGCGSADDPGNGADAYATGATDSSGAVADFSGRGPGVGGPGGDGAVKPDLVAPGVNIRSASRFGSYLISSGTSMASPHTAGTVALMWSHSPGIHGDVAATRAALDGTAADVEDLTCGGTADDNNVYGEGRLDAYAAVIANPRGVVGALGGTVTVDGEGRGGVAVTVSGPQQRRVATDPQGRFTLPRLLVGEYTVRAERFGYQASTATVTVTEGGTATSDHTLTPAPHATVSGTVRTSSGLPTAATITAVGTPVSATSGPDGRYTLRLPLGDYRLDVENTNRCAPAAAEDLSLAGDTSLDITLAERVDGYGYRCAAAPGDWVGGTERLEVDHRLSGYVREVALPFPVALYGRTYHRASVYGFGFVGFGATVDFATAEDPRPPLPSAAVPNAALYAFWDDWDYSGPSGVYTAVTGTAPNRTFVVEWRDVYNFYQDKRVSFAALLGEDGTVTYRYRNIPTDEPYSAGWSAWVGLENAEGTDGFIYSGGEVFARDGLAFTFRPGETGLARGVVTDVNDGLPVAGATATLRRDAESTTDVTGADGGFALQVPPGEYQLTVERAGYEPRTSAVTVTAGSARHQAVALSTARVTAPADATWVVPAGQQRQRTIALGNTGGLGTGYTVSERTDVAWLSVGSGAGTIRPGQQVPVTVTLDSAGLAPGTVHRAELVVASGSGRTPELTVPVTLVVPAHQFAVDAGATRGLVDSHGDAWQADRAYRSGSYGHVDRSRTRSTSGPIAGTTDPARFRTLREGMHSYRFDGLTPGAYTVELDFAEITGTDPGDRLFDLLAEHTTVLAALDIADRVGSRTALPLAFTVQVTDGSLEVEFAGNGAYEPAIVNAIRVTHRPDLS